MTFRSLSGVGCWVSAALYRSSVLLQLLRMPCLHWTQCELISLADVVTKHRIARYVLCSSKYGSESFTGAKVKGHESCLWSERSTGAKVPCSESSWNIRSWGAKVSGVKVPWNKSSQTFRSPGANIPRNESSTEAKVLSMDFSLPGTKVQRNEKSRYRITRPLSMIRVNTSLSWIENSYTISCSAFIMSL